MVNTDSIGKSEKMAISIAELATVMGIGLNKAYALANEPGFPTINVGRKRVIPVDQLKAWMAKQTKQEE